MKSNEEKEDNKKTNVFRVPGKDFERFKTATFVGCALCS